MLVTSTAISPRINSLLHKAGLDLYTAVRKSDEDLLKLKGIGETALREIRKASVHVYYSELLTTEHVRGCTLVIRPESPPTDSMHLLALLASANGFALATRGGSGQIGVLRRITTM